MVHLEPVNENLGRLHKSFKVCAKVFLNYHLMDRPMSMHTERVATGLAERWAHVFYARFCMEFVSLSVDADGEHFHFLTRNFHAFDLEDVLAPFFLMPSM